MQRQMLKSKIHRATITDCDVDYVGSITLDPELMRQADLLVNEQVHVWNIDNGARFVTYAIEGEPGSGTVQVNGAAARLVRTGDKVIIASFGAFDESDSSAIRPSSSTSMTATRSSPSTATQPCCSGKALCEGAPQAEPRSHPIQVRRRSYEHRAP